MFDEEETGRAHEAGHASVALAGVDSSARRSGVPGAGPTQRYRPPRTTKDIGSRAAPSGQAGAEAEPQPADAQEAEPQSAGADDPFANDDPFGMHLLAGPADASSTSPHHGGTTTSPHASTTGAGAHAEVGETAEAGGGAAPGSAMAPDAGADNEPSPTRAPHAAAQEGASTPEAIPQEPTDPSPPDEPPLIRSQPAPRSTDAAAATALSDASAVEVAGVQAGLIQSAAASEYHQAIAAIGQRQQLVRATIQQQRGAIRTVAATQAALARSDAKAAADRVRGRNGAVLPSIKQLIDGEVTRMSLGAQDAMARVSAASRTVSPAIRDAADNALRNANLDLRDGEGELANDLYQRLIPKAQTAARQEAHAARDRDIEQLASSRDNNVRHMRSAGDMLVRQVNAALPDVERSILASGDKLATVIEQNAQSQLAALDASERDAAAFFDRARAGARHLLDSGRATASTLTSAAAAQAGSPAAGARFRDAAAHVAPQLASRRERLVSTVDGIAQRATTTIAQSASDFAAECGTQRAIAIGNYAAAEGKLTGDTAGKVEHVRGDWAKEADAYIISANSFAAAAESNRGQLVAQLPAKFGGIVRTAFNEARKSHLRRFGEGVWNAVSGLVITVAKFVAATLIMLFAPLAFGIAALLGKVGVLAQIFRDCAMAIVGMVDAFAERFRILFRTWDDWPWYGKVAGLWTTTLLAMSDTIGLPSIYEGATGRELLSNRELSYDERGQKSFSGGLAALTSGFGARAQARRAAAAEAEASAAHVPEASAPEATAGRSPEPAPAQAADAPAPAADDLAAHADQQVILQGVDTEIAEYASRVKPKPGTLDVFVHGDIDDFLVYTGGKTPIRLNHRSLALYIKKSGKPYQRIRLVACKSGMHAKGAAQHLANKLDVVVEAPTERVHIKPDGSLTVGPKADIPTGTWEEFAPKKASLRYSPAKEPPPETAWDRLRRRREERAAQQAPAPTPDEPTSAPASPGSPGAKSLGLENPWDADLGEHGSLFDEYADDATYADDPAEWTADPPAPANDLPRGLQDETMTVRNRRAEPSRSPDRPTWQESELRVSEDLDWADFTDQTSLKGGDKVPRGTPGSIRPDNYSPRLRLSVDVKNYDLTLARGRARLVKDVTRQVHERVPHLPPGTRQGVAIDIRGQVLTPQQLALLRQQLEQASNGLLTPDDIVFVSEK